jgi:TPR repeat protein
MIQLDLCFLTGRGVQQNFQKSVRLINQAKNLGSFDGSFYSFFCLFYRYGLPPNEKEAIKKIQKLAEKGFRQQFIF